MPDGTTYFSIAKSVLRHGSTYASPAVRVAVGIGCDISYMSQLVYADDFNSDSIEPVKIGLNCYVCERPNCSSRSSPPLNREYAFSDRVRGVSSFQFEDTDGDGTP
jgi:predicted transcriptional regulator